MNLARVVGNTVFGSALSGIGFSLGRDIYKGGKKGNNLPIIIIVIIGIIAGYLSFLIGLWIGRNYNSIIKSLFVKIFSLVVFLILFSIWVSFFSTTGVGAGEERHTVDVPPEEYIQSWVFWIPIILFSIGVISGVAQRKKRRLAWVAEKQNIQFLNGIGLEVTQGDNFVDSTGQKYRIDSISKSRVVLFAIGRRNKRAFIELDDKGVMQKYSGLVSIA